jgi:hypothetical protein
LSDVSEVLTASPWCWVQWVPLKRWSTSKDFTAQYPRRLSSSHVYELLCYGVFKVWHSAYHMYIIWAYNISREKPRYFKYFLQSTLIHYVTRHKTIFFILQHIQDNSWLTQGG